MPFRLTRSLLRLSKAPFRYHGQRRTLVAAPKPNSAPLLTRRTDRELPPIHTPNYLLRTFPLFIAILVAATAGIFNYQKTNSSVVTSSLYALRTNPLAREILGDEIYYASKIPWIWGSIDQVHGHIDISFAVKGSKQKGTMRFRSERRKRMGFFETHEWSLTLDNGQVINLLEENSLAPPQQALETAAA